MKHPSSINAEKCAIKIWTADNLGQDGWYLASRDRVDNITSYPDKDHFEFVEYSAYEQVVKERDEAVEIIKKHAANLSDSDLGWLRNFLR